MLENWELIDFIKKKIKPSIAEKKKKMLDKFCKLFENV